MSNQTKVVEKYFHVVLFMPCYAVQGRSNLCVCG